MRTIPQPILRDPTQPDGRERGGLRTCERCARTVTLMRNAASIAVAATADHGGANSHRTMEALSVVSHVGTSEDYGCGQCRRLGRSSKTEGRQDDSLQRESTRRPFAVSGLRPRSAICASRIIATCCSCRCRRNPQTGMGAGSVLVVGAPARPLKRPRGRYDCLRRRGAAPHHWHGDPSAPHPLVARAPWGRRRESLGMRGSEG